MGSVPFEELDIYHLAEKISDEVWRVVLSWDNFAKDTVGKQLVRAAAYSLVKCRGDYSIPSGELP